MTPLTSFKTEQEYREDRTCTNYSALKVFSICPNLYKEQYITKEYTQPDKDYFIYGSLVDCLLTTPHELDNRFVRVEYKIAPEKMLEFEVKIKELEAEMNNPDEKGESMREKVARGHKTAMKGVESREKQIAELQEKITILKNLGDKEQVTSAMWQNAVETAEEIKKNPSFQNMIWNEFTSQQIFVDPRTNRKGIVDHVQFSDSVKHLYAALRTETISEKEYRKAIAALPESERTGRITDIKTTYRISEFEPEQYGGQLASYQRIVEAVTGIKCRCFLIAGDKDPEHKSAQDYELDQSLLDEKYLAYAEVEDFFVKSLHDNWWPSAKELKGKDQECFRCSVCRARPLSMNGPLLVKGKLFTS